jgi:hypothetical protein
VLASQDGKIVCENTVDARLNVYFKQKLPEVGRSMVCFRVASIPLVCAHIRHNVRAFLLQIRKQQANILKG